MAIGLGFQWKGNVTRLAPLLEVAERELHFYGITLFHIGIGVLVSKKVRLTKRSAASLPADNLKGNYET